MNIVIVGGGKIGFSIAQELALENHDVIVVEKDPERAAFIEDTIDVMSVCGNGAVMDVQRRAGVPDADLMIAVTAGDELNQLACMIARKLGCQNTIARVRDREYSMQLHELKDEMRLSMAINPEQLAAREIFKLLQFPAFVKRDTFAEGKAEIVELEVTEGSPLDGLRLMDMYNKIRVRALVCVVVRSGEAVIPDGTAPATELVRLTHELRLRNRKSKNVIVVGGGRIAEYLIPMLLRSGTRVKVIEKNRQRCNYLDEYAPDADVICSDGSSQSVLKLHNIAAMDAIVPLTNMDEENILIAMFARKIGVPQVLTKLNRVEYGEMLCDRDADSVISPKLLSSHTIVSYVRAMENTEGSAVMTIRKLAGGKAEAQEFAVTDATKNLGVPLMDLKLKSGILIACIHHGGKVIIPGGHDMLQSGDTVVLVTTAGRSLLDLNDIFGRE